MTESTVTEEDDSPVNAWKVTLNVLSVLTIIVSVVMSILGFVYLENCISQRGLPITLVIQGFITAPMPIWFLLKYRLLLPIKNTIFVTVFIIMYIFFMTCLIACTRLLAISGCEESTVYKVGVGFVVILWIASVIFGLVACMKGLVKLASDRD